MTVLPLQNKRHLYTNLYLLRCDQIREESVGDACVRHGRVDKGAQNFGR
jgi:hypothetical protein